MGACVVGGGGERILSIPRSIVLAMLTTYSIQDDGTLPNNLNHKAQGGSVFWYITLSIWERATNTMVNYGMDVHKAHTVVIYCIRHNLLDTSLSLNCINKKKNDHITTLSAQRTIHLYFEKHMKCIHVNYWVPHG